MIEQTAFNGERIPIRCAVVTTFFAPSATTSCAKIVFTEWPIASSRFIGPGDSSA